MKASSFCSRSIKWAYISALVRQRRVLVLLIRQRLDIYVIQYLTNKHVKEMLLIVAITSLRLLNDRSCNY